VKFRGLFSGVAAKPQRIKENRFKSTLACTPICGYAAYKIPSARAKRFLRLSPELAVTSRAYLLLPPKLAVKTG